MGRARTGTRSPPPPARRTGRHPAVVEVARSGSAPRWTDRPRARQHHAQPDTRPHQTPLRTTAPPAPHRGTTGRAAQHVPIDLLVQVRYDGCCPTRRPTEEAVRHLLGALGRRLTGDERRELAARLPTEAAVAFTAQAPATTPVTGWKFVRPRSHRPRHRPAPARIRTPVRPRRPPFPTARGAGVRSSPPPRTDPSSDGGTPAGKFPRGAGTPGALTPDTARRLMDRETDWEMDRNAERPPRYTKNEPLIAGRKRSRQGSARGAITRYVLVVASAAVIVWAAWGTVAAR
ncbi:DUF2267 domain-containing protein [Streptomyces sp. NPDC056734]